MRTVIVFLAVMTMQAQDVFPCAHVQLSAWGQARLVVVQKTTGIWKWD